MIAADPIDAMWGLDDPRVQLVLCFVFDALGMVTYLVPVIGEFGDLVYAPIQAAFVGILAGRERFGLFFIGFSFAEEILPFTDFIPSCLIAWLWKYLRR